MTRRKALSLVGLIVAVVVGGVLWRRLRGSNEIEVRTVILITLDTFRADRVGAYGDQKGLTPTLDTLAKEGVRFERALTTAPITLPAHASILSGTDPIAHGVRVNGAHGFAPDNPSLAKVLKDEGFTTGAFISAKVLDRQYGLANGFDQYECRMADEDGTFDPSPRERRGERTVQAALEFVKENPIPRLFLWVHLFDAHAPYDAPEPFSLTYDDPYDAELAYVDHCVSQLKEGLKAEGRLEDTLIAVVADHGEGLGDHGESTHTVFNYDSTMRVPMILWAPNRLPQDHVVKSSTSVISLAPTLIDILGFEKPPGMYGVSHSAAIMEKRPADASDIYFESEAGAYYYGFLPLMGLESDGAKLIARQIPKDYEGVKRRELYFPRTDVGELDDRFEAERDLRRVLDQRLSQYIERHRTDRMMRRDMTPDDIQTLKELGYISSLQVGNGAMDPIDGIALVERLIAISNRAESDPRGAEADVRALIAEQPDVAEAHELLGDLLAAKIQRGEIAAIPGLEAACESWSKAADIRRPQTDPATEVKAAEGDLMLSMAMFAAASAAGAPVPAKVEELVTVAKKRCEDVLKLETNNVRARVILARVRLNRENDPVGARRLLNEVIDGDLEKEIAPNADDSEARFWRSRCLRSGATPNPRLALKDLREAVRLDPHNQLYLVEQGELHLQMRQPDEAVKIFQSILDRDPVEVDPQARSRAENGLRMLGLL